MDFSEEVVYKLDTLLFQTKHGSMWVHTYISEIGVWWSLSQNELHDHCSSKWQLLRKIIQLFWHSSLPCRIQQDGVTAHSVTIAVGFFSVTSSVITLSDLDFGYQNSQTLCHLTFLWGFLKESRARTQESWRTFNITLNRLLPALTNKLFKKLHKSTVKMVIACLEEGGGLLSICCNCTLFSTFLLPLKTQK